MYLDRGWQKENRREEKKRRNTKWLKGGFDTVIMVPATPGGELAKKYQEVVTNNPGPVKIKILEKGGTQVKHILQKNNPNKSKGCNILDCLACNHGRGKGENAGRTTWDMSYCVTCVGERTHPMFERQVKIFTQGA